MEIVLRVFSKIARRVRHFMYPPPARGVYEKMDRNELMMMADRLTDRRLAKSHAKMLRQIARRVERGYEEDTP